MALRALRVVAPQVNDRITVAQLYRSIIKELPRVLNIYDVAMPISAARAAVAIHFRRHQGLKDERIINILIAKGYMEMEETLMQWKQKTHLLRLLEPIVLVDQKKEKNAFGDLFDEEDI